MKKYLLIGLIISFSFISSGCIKRDTMEGIDIYTTTYPIEYITNRLYGENANIYSIYPDGIIIDDYTLTEKQIKDYSKSGLYIFNGLSNEKDYVIPMFDHNKNIKIIDTSLTLSYENDVNELWLDPSNFLMMAQNVKNGFKEYISNYYLEEEIDENYEELKLEVSELDAKIKLMIESAGDPRIVVTNDLFKFLEKYGFEVISLEKNDNLTEKTVEDTKILFENEEVHYIFAKQNEELSDVIIEILAGNDNIEVVYLHTLNNLSEAEKDENKDYISIMNHNLELLKDEIYN